MAQRTQITLDPEQHRRARQHARELGISLAEYVRRLIARDLREDLLHADVSAILALGDSGGSDIARDKDDYIAEAVDALHQRR